MPMYRERTTGEIKSHLEWKKQFSNVSLPKVWKEATIDGLGLDEVVETEPPSTNQLQEVELTGASQDSDGVWKQTWTIVDKFSDLTDEDGNVVQTKAERELEYTTQLDRANAIKNRATRNSLLKESDWTQMNDSPLSNEDKDLWATYRTALRTLPEHINWPNLEDADWPVKP